VRDLADTLEEVMFVGHNPGLAELGLLLARRGVLRDRVAAKLPTGALVTLEADVSRWSAIGPGTADIVGLVLPRELA
jgi:phosphohistidine phosphatase